MLVREDGYANKQFSAIHASFFLSDGRSFFTINKW
jgi:hypothetical protein